MVAASIIIWLLSSFTTSFSYTTVSSNSLLAATSRQIAFIFQPQGFDFWQAVVALVSGLVAKETIVSSFSVIYSVDKASLYTTIASAFTQASALSFMAFVLLYTPCIATMGAIKKEIGGKWLAFSVAMQLILAYGLSAVVYQVAHLIIK